MLHPQRWLRRAQGGCDKHVSSEAELPEVRGAGIVELLVAAPRGSRHSRSWDDESLT